MTSKEYMKDYYRRRSEKAIAYLGGSCVTCNATVNLEFDHIDPSTKSFDVLKGFRRKEVFWKEVDKCQLLCSPCHKRKTQENRDHGRPLPTHGSYWRYRKYKCRCASCVEGNSAQIKAWKQAR